MPPLSLLGPQRLQPMVKDVLEAMGIAGPIAVVTAGWEEREKEDEELRDHLHGPTVNLRLFDRTERVFRRDPELLAGFRQRRARVTTEQELYSTRLAHALDACRELMARDTDDPAARSHLEAALETVRRLDHEHLERLREIQAAFETEFRPAERPAVAAQRDAVAEKLEGSAALAIAGGHVVVLLNRLRLFDLLRLAADLPILAWSAGAMVLGERVVAFHDSPPQGPGNAEVVENGLGHYRDLLPFPHARRRLRLGDPRRVALLSRRFATLQCVPLDEGSWLSRDGEGWEAPAPVRRLGRDGAVTAIDAGELAEDS